MLLRAAMLLVLLSGAAAGEEASQPVADARAELERVAARIEVLKRERRPEDVELQRLLARAQELADRIDGVERGRAPAPPQASGPDPQELHERADALRDQADRMETALAEVDRELERVRRRRELEGRVDALAAEGGLFDESGRGRLSPPAAGTVGPSSVGPGIVPGAPSSALLPPGTERHGLPELAPRPGDSEQALRQKRAALQREIPALRARAQELDEEAKRAGVSR